MFNDLARNAPTSTCTKLGSLLSPSDFGVLMLNLFISATMLLALSPMSSELLLDMQDDAVRIAAIEEQRGDG